MAELVGFSNANVMRDAIVFGEAFSVNRPHVRHFYETALLGSGEPAVAEFVRLVRSGEMSAKYPGKTANEVLRHLERTLF